MNVHVYVGMFVLHDIIHVVKRSQRLCKLHI